MTTAEHIRLTAQLAVLKEVETEYRGLTIGNVIQQIEARLKEVTNAN